MERTQQRRRAGVEHERVGLVPIDQGSGGDGVGDVGHLRRDRVTEVVAQRFEQVSVAGDRNHVRTVGVQRRRDRPAEAPARTGD
jgi:hypothetical protein